MLQVSIMSIISISCKRIKTTQSYINHTRKIQTKIIFKCVSGITEDIFKSFFHNALSFTLFCNGSQLGFPFNRGWVQSCL